MRIDDCDDVVVVNPDVQQLLVTKELRRDRFSCGSWHPLGRLAGGNLKMLGSDTGRQFAVDPVDYRLSRGGTGISRFPFLSMTRPLLLSAVMLKKFIAGLPMKPATNLLTGRS